MLRMWFDGVKLAGEVWGAILFGPAPPMRTELEYDEQIARDAVGYLERALKRLERDC